MESEAAAEAAFYSSKRIIIRASKEGTTLAVALSLPRSLKGVSHSSGPIFLPILFIRQILLCPIPPLCPKRRRNAEEAIKPGRPLFVAWNGRGSHSRPLARACPDTCRGDFKIGQRRRRRRDAWRSGRIFVALYSLVEVREVGQPRISGEYISVSLRKCDLLLFLRVVAESPKTWLFEQPPSFVCQVGDGVHALQLHN